VAIVLLDRPTGTYRFVRRGPPPLREGRWEIGTPPAYEVPEAAETGDDSASRQVTLPGSGQVVFRMNDPLMEALLRAPGPVRYERLLTELGAPLQQEHHPLAELRPQLVVPLRQRNELIGVMTIGSKLADTGFNSEEIMLLSLLASQMSVAVENAWLHEERLEQERMREELAVARKIQQDLLPPRFPRGIAFEVSAINLPSREIGGDYFDFVTEPAEHTAEVESMLMVIADVSGKGTPAALLMASLQATLRAVYEVQPDLAAAAEKVNTVIHRTTDAEKFITLFMAVYEVATRTLRYTNAGHNFPILTRGTGEQIRLEEGGLLLGVLEQTSYREQRIQLESGDLLVMYTDGVTEAQNEAGEEYGEERLARLLQDHLWLGARELRDEIYRDVLAFAGSQPQVDDLTLVILKIR
jgi:phosphoserine phosphatase RsbU/P